MATRYHSLVIESESIAGEFVQSAWTDDGVCMGIRWTGNGSSLEGVQFHPESILSPQGQILMDNFLHVTKQNTKLGADSANGC